MLEFHFRDRNTVKALVKRDNLSTFSIKGTLAFAYILYNIIPYVKIKEVTVKM